MRQSLSARARAIAAPTYEDFPLPPGAVDLRGDHAPSPVAGLLAEAWRSSAARTHELVTYSDPQGSLSLREEIAGRFSVKPDAVLVTAGASEAIMIALLLVADAGGRIALSRPGFPAYEQLARCIGLEVVSYDPAVPAAIQVGGLPSPPSAIVTVSPHNPTGFALEEAPGDGAARERPWSVRDISHAPEPLLGAGDWTDQEHDMLIFSFSKGLRIPALRVGCLIARDLETMRAATALKTHLSMAVSIPVQRFLLTLLRDPELPNLIRSQQQLYARNRLVITDAIRAANSLSLVGGEAGTHLVVRGRDREGEVALWSRLGHAGIGGLPGSVFAAPYACVRLSYGQTAADIDRSGTRIASL